MNTTTDAAKFAPAFDPKTIVADCVAYFAGYAPDDVLDAFSDAGHNIRRTVVVKNFTGANLRTAKLAAERLANLH